MTQAKSFNTNVPALLQLSLMLFSSLVLFFVSKNRVDQYRARENYDYIKFVTPQLAKEFGGVIEAVEVGVIVNQYEKFDVAKNDFVFSGIVWFMLDPGILPVEAIEKFSFEFGEVLSQSKPSVYIVNKKLLVQYHVRVRFSSQLDYKSFPFDDHKLYLVLANKFFYPYEAVFSSVESNLIVKPRLSALGWKAINYNVEVGYAHTVLSLQSDKREDTYPVASFSIDYSRKGIRYIVGLLMPLLFLLFIGFFSFSVHSKGVEISLATLTALLGYRFVIESFSPSVGYFMLSDYLYFFYVALGLALVVINLVDNLLPQPISKLHKEIFLYVFHGLLSIGSSYFILFW